MKPGPKGKFAGTVRVGEKGQVVIPKEIRDLFDIHPGDTLLMLADITQGIAVVKEGVVFDRLMGQLGLHGEKKNGE